MAEAGSKTFLWVQILRGIAASMVVCYHYVGLQVIRGQEVEASLRYFGTSGVDIFFVISGFIMMMSQPDAGTSSAKTFLFRRLLRIAPLYWVLTTAAFVLALLFAPTGITAGLGATAYVMSMMFLPYSETYVPMSRRADGTYILPMAWTLTYEWFFYLLFALAMVLGLKSYKRLLFLGVVFGCCAVVGLVFEPAPLLLQMVTSVVPFQFLLGCTVALMYRRGVRLGAVPASITAVLALIVLSHSPTSSFPIRTLIWGMAGFFLVAAASLVEAEAFARRLRPLTRLGDISYSVYLSHWFAVALFPKLQDRIEVLADGFGAIAIVSFVVLTVAIAEVCYRFVEEPARHFVARRLRRRTTASSGAVIQ